MLDNEITRESAWPALVAAASAETALAAVFCALVVLPEAAALSLACRWLTSLDDAAGHGTAP